MIRNERGRGQRLTLRARTYFTERARALSQVKGEPNERMFAVGFRK